jgi:hypothetical protein
LASVIAALLSDEKSKTFEISEAGNFEQKSTWRGNRLE